MWSSSTEQQDCGRRGCPRWKLALAGQSASIQQPFLWRIPHQQRVGSNCCSLLLQVSIPKYLPTQPYVDPNHLISLLTGTCPFSAPTHQVMLSTWVARAKRAPTLTRYPGQSHRSSVIQTTTVLPATMTSVCWSFHPLCLLPTSSGQSALQQILVLSTLALWAGSPVGGLSVLEVSTNETSYKRLQME